MSRQLTGEGRRLEARSKAAQVKQGCRQPLHATARFSHERPHGDQGGNLSEVTNAAGVKMKLHAYWDRLFGGYSTPYGEIFDGLTNPDTKLPEPDPALAAEANPQKWFEESQKLAIDVSYAEPVKSGTSPVILDRSYEVNAMVTARKQAALAAARLANLIYGFPSIDYRRSQ